MIGGLGYLMGREHSDRVRYAVTVGDEFLKKHASVFEEAFSRLALLLLPSPALHRRCVRERRTYRFLFLDEENTDEDGSKGKCCGNIIINIF